MTVIMIEGRVLYDCIAKRSSKPGFLVLMLGSQNNDCIAGNVTVALFFDLRGHSNWSK